MWVHMCCSAVQASGCQRAHVPGQIPFNISVMMNAAKGRPIIRTNPAGQDIHSEVVCDGCNACPIVGIRYRSLTLPDHDLCEQCHSKPCSALAAPFEHITSGTACHSMHPPRPCICCRALSTELSGMPLLSSISNLLASVDAGGSTQGNLPEALNRKLAMWVWHYFTGEALPGFEPPGSQCCSPAQLLLRSSPVVLSGGLDAMTCLCLVKLATLHFPSMAAGKPPLYFQHQGHSRTIIGIEQHRMPNGAEAELTLLVLDPSNRTEKLSDALKNQNGWQQQLRRGLHTLGNKDHQLLYVEAGLTAKQDCTAWKHIRPIQVFQ